MSDMLYNWNNKLASEDKLRVIAALNDYESRGVAYDRARDMLIASGEDIDVVNAAIHQRMAQTAQAKSSPSWKGFPRSYTDIMPQIEELVYEFPIADTLDILANPTNTRGAIVKMSQKDIEDFSALLKMAKQQPDSKPVIEAIHNTIRPHVEKTLKDVKIASRQAQEKSWKVEASRNGTIVEDSARNRTEVVDLPSRTCTCYRFTTGGFAHLGMVCEHLIRAAAAAQPELLSEMALGYRVVEAQSQGPSRYAWCRRYESEISIKTACVDGECPFLVNDKGTTIHCGFDA